MLAIALMILLPLFMALLLLWPPFRPAIVAALGLAPLPALLLAPAAWNGSASAVTLPGGWSYVVDQAGALMLLASALLWIIGGLAASRWLKRQADAGRFALWWLLTLSGSLGVFVAGDLVSFYALYALASLPAYGLIAFSGSEDDRRAGRITLAAALVGEGLILAAFVLMAVAVPGQGLAFAPLVHGLAQTDVCGPVIALAVAGFGLKIGLVPLHGWMPMSYAAGPLAATAVLSGATSKAGIIGLIRVLPHDAAMPVAGGLIVAMGLVAAFWGALAGLTQHNPRSVLAYSSVSQLGQMAAVLGAGLAAGLPGAGAVVAYYAAYHILVKGGLFLMLGGREAGRAMPGWQLAFTGFLALGFAGLPLSGGALGKLAFKDVVGSGAIGLLFSLAAIGSTMLVLHFLRLARGARGEALPAAAWIVTGLVATLLQWGLFAAVTGGSPAGMLKPGVLFDLAWPIAAGGLAAWGLAAAGTQAPRLPPGDVGAAGIAFVERASRRFVPMVLAFEQGVRRWQVSSLLIAAAVLAFAVALGLPALR